MQVPESIREHYCDELLKQIPIKDLNIYKLIISKRLLLICRSCFKIILSLLFLCSICCFFYGIYMLLRVGKFGPSTYELIADLKGDDFWRSITFQNTDWIGVKKAFEVIGRIPFFASVFLILFLSGRAIEWITFRIEKIDMESVRIYLKYKNIHNVSFSDFITESLSSKSSN